MRLMTYDDLIEHFETQVAAAAFLGINQSNLSDWKRKEGIPPIRQLKIEAMTDGKLKAGPECDKLRFPAKQA